MIRVRARALLGLLLVLTGGCYTGSARTANPARMAADPDWIWIRDVPALRQTSDADCGAAALAMVLQHWGVPVTPADITAAHPPKKGQGIRAGDLRAFARARGIDAYLIAGRMDDLVRELDAARPVLVGMVQRYMGNRGVAHYEVVVGINRRARRIATLDPARGLREDSFEGFATEWVAAKQVALVVSGRGQAYAPL